MPEQLTFSFVAEIAQQAEKARELEACRMKRANAIAILRAHVKQYPMTDYERRVVPKGVRLSRFVIGWECAGCPYAYKDHSLGNEFGIDRSAPWGPSVPLVCLKDYYEKGYGNKDRA